MKRRLLRWSSRTAGARLASALIVALVVGCGGQGDVAGVSGLDAGIGDSPGDGWVGSAPDLPGSDGAARASDVSTAGDATPPAEIAPFDAGHVEVGPMADAGDVAPLAGLNGLSVSPPALALAVGGTMQLVAIATFEGDQTADVTAAAAWESANPGVAGVAEGLVSAITPGATTVTATFGGLARAVPITVGAVPIVSLAVLPQAASVGVGGTTTFGADATLADGAHQDVTAMVTWSSSVPSVASVSATGEATGLSAGTTSIRATIGTISAEATLAVSGAILQSVALTPSSPSVAVGAQITFVATGLYDDGSTADLSGSATWASSAPGVLLVSGGGEAWAKAPGTAIVSASTGGVTGFTVVSVSPATLVSMGVTPTQSTLPPGASVQLKAQGTYSDGTVSDLTKTAIWTSSTPPVAAVSNGGGAEGRVVALAAGTTTITATLGGVSASATVEVTAAALQMLAISPPSATIPKATSTPLVAKGTYSDGNVLDVTSLTSWTSTAPGVATVGNTGGTKGVVLGLAPGTAEIQAASGGFVAKAAITVTPAVLQSIALEPAELSVAIGVKQAFKAKGVYSDGATIDVTSMALWTTSDASLLAVSNAKGAWGIVTALGAGSATITASVGPITQSAKVTITEPTAVSLVLAPIDPIRTVGQWTQFSATVLYSNNTSQNVTQQTDWKSANAGVGALSTLPWQTGLVHAVGPGTSVITGTYKGLAGTSKLTVTEAEPVAISMMPIAPTIPVGAQQIFVATAILSDGTTQIVNPQATWTSSDPDIATVQNAPLGQKGRVTGKSVGTCQIVATYQGLTGTATVSVTDATIVELTVFPGVTTAPVGAWRQFNAQAILSDNTSKDVTAQATWVSSDPQTAGVMTAVGPNGQGGEYAGLAKGVAPGKVIITATFKGLSGSATMTVTAATVSQIQVTPFDPVVAVGVPVKFSAVAILTDDTSQEITGQASWTSSAPAVADVANVGVFKGLAQTIAPGKAEIQATWNGVTGASMLEVKGATLVEIQVTPFAPLVPLGFALQLQATGLYSDETVQDLTPMVSWISSDDAVASVSSQLATKGLLLGVGAGAVTIEASFLGVTGKTIVTVSGAALTKLAVSPPQMAVASGATQPFVAAGTFSDGFVMDVTVFVTWLSSKPTVAPVSNATGTKGQAKALSKGTTTITATKAGVSATATLAVN